MLIVDIRVIKCKCHPFLISYSYPIPDVKDVFYIKYDAKMYL